MGFNFDGESVTLDLKDSIKFDVTETNFTPREIAEHLLALEKMIAKVPFVLENILSDTNVKISVNDIYLSKLEEGSLIEEFRATLELFSDKEKLESLKKNIMDNKLLVLALGLGVSVCAYKGCTPPQNITNSIVNDQVFAVNNITLTDKQLEKVVSAVQKKVTPTDKKNAINYLRPVRRRGGSVSFGQDAPVEIKQDKLKLIPEYYEPQVKTEMTDSLFDVEIDFRAHDIDKIDSGWAAIIPDVHPDKRIKLELQPTVDRNSLLSKRKIRADIEVLYRLNKDSKTPVKATVIKVY